MPYQTVAMPVVGGTAQNRSEQANAELTLNWYPEVVQDGRSPAQLLPWYGVVAFGGAGDTTDRGTHVFNDELYQLTDIGLYKIDSSGIASFQGAISGTGRAIFADNGEEMAIASNGFVYAYSALGLITQGDAATFANTQSVTMLNNQFIYDLGGDQFAVSNVGDALTISSLNFANAESAGDALLRCYSFGQYVYLFGSATVETWWNSGVGNPPFDRIEGGILQKGLAAVHSVANTDQALYFIGDDNVVYKVIQTQITPISTPSISYQINKLDVTNAEGYTLNLNGQDFYIMVFGNTELSYAYSEQLNEWFCLSSGVTNERYIGSSYQKAYGKRLLVDYSSNNIVELSDTAFDELGSVVIRSRILPPLNSATLGLGAGQRLIMEKAKIILQTGKGLATGQGENPQIMVSFSRDGEVFSAESFIDIGAMGKFFAKVEFWKMVSFYDLSIKITISDPVFTALQDGAINIKADGY